MILIALFACGGGASAPAAHDHDDAHDEGHAHDGSHAHDEAHHGDKTPLDASMIEVAMGSHTARLVPGVGTVELQILGDGGENIPARGEARMVVTGTGEPAQKVVLKPQGSSWRGEADVSGAPGYVAVVSVPLAGTTQSARFAWGDVRQAAPAPKKPHDHGDGDHHDHDDHGHDH